MINWQSWLSPATLLSWISRIYIKTFSRGNLGVTPEVLTSGLPVNLTAIPICYPFVGVPTPSELAAVITIALPNVKRGTLRFWGQWFGRPYDNIHTVVSCDATDACLRLRFDGGEVLGVWNPLDVEIDARKFRIGNAASIRWSWYYYGRPKIPENLFYIDYARQQDGSIAFRTNRDQTPGTGTLDSSASFPAVEMF